MRISDWSSDVCSSDLVVGLLVPVGRTNAAQLRELAALAADYGSGEVRFTVQQNALIPDVAAARVEELLREPLLRELSAHPSPFVRGLVTCTGKDRQSGVEGKSWSLRVDTGGRR